MEIFKVDICKSTYFYSNEENDFRRDNSILLIGRQDFNEYRSILEIDTSRIKEACIDEENILKVELNLFLGQILVDEAVNEYGIDICRNIEKIDLKEINSSNYPKFKQSYAMYNIKEDFISKLVKLDITYLKKFLFSEEGLGITIVGLGAGGVVKFQKVGENTPYLNIQCKKVKRLEKKKEKASYGFFISDKIDTMPIKNYRAVRWSNAILEKGISISGNEYEIDISMEGVYSIDYSLNVRSEEEGRMFLNIDSEELEYSSVKTTFDEHGYTGSIIAKCNEKSKISLCIIGKSILIQEFDGTSKIRIIKIN